MTLRQLTEASELPQFAEGDEVSYFKVYNLINGIMKYHGKRIRGTDQAFMDLIMDVNEFEGMFALDTELGQALSLYQGDAEAYVAREFNRR